MLVNPHAQQNNMTSFTRKLLILSCLLFTSFCFWKVGTGLIDGADAEILPSAQAAMSPSLSPPRVVTTPIQQMRPGMRVVGRNPIRIQTESTIDPTPESWRLVSVRMLKPDGTYFEAELLRPLSWIHRHQAQPGAVIQLNMPELHVVGAAEVLSVSGCPPIDPGDGPVVISMFKNVADNILNIYVEGETEPIGVTAGHPIWSEDRQAFIHSDQLQPGERLRSALGRTVRITSIEIRAGPEPVYNLEVAGEHVYSVTDSGLLVHNTCPEVPELYQLPDWNGPKLLEGPSTARASDIRWTHDDIKWYTREEKTDLFTLSQLADQGKLTEPVLDVIVHEGQLYSLNNRRLAAYKMSSIQDIPIRIRSKNDPYWNKKFERAFTSYEHKGVIVKIRGTGNRTTPRMYIDLEGQIHKGMVQ